MMIFLKYGLFVYNIILLIIAVGYYNKYHKLSSTLLIIVLLSILFQNLEFVIISKETALIIQKASRISIILFSFSILISVIQAGTLSVKYMYLPIVRKTTWFLSFLMLFLGFFLHQYYNSPEVYNDVKTNIIEISTIILIFIVGVFSFINKKQYLLLIGASSYLIILIIGYFFIDKTILFSLSQISFVTFLLINERESIKRSKNRLIVKEF